MEIRSTIAAVLGFFVLVAVDSTLAQGQFGESQDIYLKTFRDRFVTVERRIDGLLVGNRNQATAQEKFRMDMSGNQISLLSYWTGRRVRVTSDGYLRADGGTADLVRSESEWFTLIPLDIRKWAIQARNGLFVRGGIDHASARSALAASSNHVREWETFKIQTVAVGVVLTPQPTAAAANLVDPDGDYVHSGTANNYHLSVNPRDHKATELFKLVGFKRRHGEGIRIRDFLDRYLAVDGGFLTPNATGYADAELFRVYLLPDRKIALEATSTNKFVAVFSLGLKRLTVAISSVDLATPFLVEQPNNMVTGPIISIGAADRRIELTANNRRVIVTVPQSSSASALNLHNDHNEFRRLFPSNGRAKVFIDGNVQPVVDAVAPNGTLRIPRPTDLAPDVQ